MRTCNRRELARQVALQLSIACGFIVVSTSALADYECSKKETDASPAQRELFVKAAAAMRAAFLPPPEGWTMRSPDLRTPGTKFCVDFKNDPVTFGSSASYVIKPTVEALRKYRESQKAERAEIDALKVLPPDLQAKIDELENQGKTLRAEAREAERAKNRDLAKAKYDEVQDLNRKVYAIRSDYSIKMAPQERAIYKKYEKDRELNRDVSANVSITANAAPASTDANAERVVFGNATAKTNQATDKIVRISVNFEKSDKLTPAQFDTLKKLVDRTKLQAIMAGNIPSIEESKAANVALNEAIATADKKARETENMVEKEARDSAQAAKKQAADEEKAKTAASAPKVEPPATPATKTESPAATTTAATASKPATPPAAAPATPAPSNPADAVKDAKDTVNKLRGLFGR